MRGADRGAAGRESGESCLTRPLRFAIVGCGNISGPYGETARAYPSVEIVGATDIDRALSAAFVERFGGIDYPSLEAAARRSGGRRRRQPDLPRHPRRGHRRRRSRPASTSTARSRWPASYAEARALVELADANGLRLSCSPITFMGDAQQTAWSLLAAGAIGTVRVVYAEVNWGRIETWHPRPAPFYAIGPMADVGVYPLTYLTAIFGPGPPGDGARQDRLPRPPHHLGRAVHGGRTRFRGRADRARRRDARAADDELLRRASTASSAGSSSTATTGRCSISSWQDFDAAVELAPYGGTYEPVPVPGAFRGVDWGRALGELAAAISEERPHRATGAHAAHVVEILDAVETSIDERDARSSSTSTFPAPRGRPSRGRGRHDARMGHDADAPRPA